MWTAAPSLPGQVRPLRPRRLRMGARGGGEARTRPALRRAVLAQQVRTRPARTGRLDRRRPPAGQVPDAAAQAAVGRRAGRSEEHTSELQSLMRISYAVF